MLWSASDDIPLLPWVTKYKARNHVDRGSLVAWNSVPAVTAVWRWQRGHWYSQRRRSTPKVVLPHSGQTKPLGQRRRATASRQASALP